MELGTLMPNTSGRRRAPSHYRGKPRRQQPAGQRTDGRQQPRPESARSELDRALAAAAEMPPPPPATFAELGLDGRLVAALAVRDIHQPFAIQARALPDALAGRDVLGRAETGSGKTLAFGLPMLTRIASLPGRVRGTAPRGLILVPTRELAQQVAAVLTPLGRSIGVSVTTVYGGVPIGRQITRVANGVDIVVATPGRLIDLIERRACTLTDIQVTVLDEADHMADLGFLPSVTRILDETPAGGQRLLFSATLDRGVDQLVRAYLVDPALHAVTPEIISGGAAEHSMLVVDSDEKVAVAAEMAGRPARTLFFVRTKHGADRLAKQLERAGVAAAAIHGDRNQNQRQRALDAFSAGYPRVLVATDVAARGIHVDGVELVVHFDPPNDHKDYLHRSGRTARAGATGLVVTLALREQVRELQRLHEAAGVDPARHHVAAGHPVVQEIATTGTPVPPPPPAPERRPRPAGTPPRARRGAARPSGAGSYRATSPGTASPRTGAPGSGSPRTGSSRAGGPGTGLPRTSSSQRAASRRPR
jgi:superfamily II DNA/RNA helicase